MRVAIDVQTTLGQKTGFGFYVKNLIRNLRIVDPKNKYILLSPLSEKDLSTPQRFNWDQFKFPKLAKAQDAEILHQPCFSAPIFHSNMKVVVTIHDLIAIKFPRDITFFSSQFFGKWMPFSYHFADKIIAISEHTKKDIIKFLNIPEKKIRVIHLAAGSEFNENIATNKVERIRKKYNTGNKYLLHTGTLNPRKNLEFLILVFAEIIKTHPDYNLVIAGKKGWYFEGLFKLVGDLNLKNKVKFVGYVPDEDSPALYKGAALFLFPSLYEGFGLPPLEAMACGCPVISSNTSSMPEVIGEEGILVSPKDKAAWVRIIKELLSNPNLRRKYIKYSLRQAKKFSWKKCAEETLKVYEEIYENSH